MKLNIGSNFWKIAYIVGISIITVFGILVILAEYHGTHWEHKRAISSKLGLYTSGYKQDYVYDLVTGEEVLPVDWIVEPKGNDSIAIFYWGDKRGYFNVNNGRIVAQPQYDAAWIFRSGVGGVAKNDSVFFIGLDGKPINDKKFPYETGHDYLYNGEFCKIKIGDKYGMINKQGEWMVEPLWDEVLTNIATGEFFLFKDGNEINVSYVADSIMKAPVLEFKGDTIFVPSDTTIIYVKQELSK